MRTLKIIAVAVLLILFSAFAMEHQYYISNTHVEYVKEKKSVQIISRVFTDDFEDVLRERYDETLFIDNENSEKTDQYIERYLLEKFKIQINGKYQKPVFLGKKIDMEIVKCYLEIENVKDISSINISNQILFDLFSEQQNIIKLNINNKKKNFVLTKQKDKASLIFN